MTIGESLFLKGIPIDTRTRIIDVAVGLFTEYGIESTSLRRIAEELGVTKAALYYHFPSKLDLIQSTTAPIIDDMELLMAELERTPDFAPRQVLQAYFDFTIGHLRIYQMLMRNPGIMVELELVPKFMDWRQRFEMLLVGPNATPEQRARATVAFGGVSDCVVMLPDIPVEELRSVSVRAACDALGID